MTTKQNIDDSEYLVLNKMACGYNYNRSMCISSKKLIGEIARLYNKEHCVITTSGLNAISSLLNTLCILYNVSPRINLIYSSELYTESPKLFKQLTKSYKNVVLHKFNILNQLELENTYRMLSRGYINILFVESCSNPNSIIFDFSIIPKLRAFSDNLYVVVDNTWLTHVCMNPFDHGADFVLISTTKYYSGGQAIGGAIISGNILLKGVHDYNKINGLHVSPHNCDVLLSNLPTITDRILRSAQLTQLVIGYLESNPKVLNVSNPFCKNHFSHDMASRFFKKINEQTIYPSVLTFQIIGTKSKLKKVTKSSIIEYKTSFGSKMSRIDPYPYNIENVLVCRLSIGFDDIYERIVDGLQFIINNM